MSIFSRSISMLAIGTAVSLLAALTPAPLFAKTTKFDCTKSGKLQATIDSAASGDTIEISGICSENILIRDKALTLIGAASGGPHGIQGIATDTAALTISRSNNAVLQNLSFSNGAGVGVRILYSSVSMTDCKVSNNVLSGVTVTDSSHFNGLRLRADENGGRGLQAFFGSRADCLECDLNDNGSFAAVQSAFNSFVTMQDSVVSGRNGLASSGHSHIDIDCASFVTTHGCSLNATQIAGRTSEDSTVAFYGAGDFDGAFAASGGSTVSLYGARQQSTGWKSDSNHDPRSNSISDNAWLRVDPGDDGVTTVESRLMGTTEVSAFSRALISGVNTELDGSLNCTSAGDAWVDPAVDLVTPGFSITGCEHAP